MGSFVSRHAKNSRSFMKGGESRDTIYDTGTRPDIFRHCCRLGVSAWRNNRSIIIRGRNSLYHYSSSDCSLVQK